MLPEELDVVIIGAGLSGIAAAAHLQRRLPGQRFAVLEARAALGGTWDLFRYPGVRSDSDMFTLGYTFRPWPGREAIASGEAIRAYLRQTALDTGVAAQIRYRHRLLAAAWDSASARWTVTVRRDDEPEPIQLRCRFLWMCTGYYRYDGGYRPTFAGESDFGGRIVHPQSWPEDLDCRDQRVVIIGSGATAVSLAPALAGAAASVTILQRSPTYLVARPRVSRVINALRTTLPAAAGTRLARGLYLLRDSAFYQVAMRLPGLTRRLLRGLLRRSLGPGFDLARDFTPRYAPWRQRLCLVPDGDLFACLKAGTVNYKTGTIARIAADGVVLDSGEQLAADVIVTATGLRMAVMPDIALHVDGAAIDLSKTLVYKGCMYSGLPNLISIFGYANASWTLKAELVCAYACRVLKQLARRGDDYCVPVAENVVPTDAPLMALDAGYVVRAAAELPRQGAHPPWRMHHNYWRDGWALRWAPVTDGELHFHRCRAASAHAPERK